MEQTLGVAYGWTDELTRVRELVGCKNASHLKKIITVKMFQFFFAIQITLIGFGCSIPQYCRHFRLSQQCCTLKKYRMYQRTVPVQDVPKICIKILSSFLSMTKRCKLPNICCPKHISENILIEREIDSWILRQIIYK